MEALTPPRTPTTAPDSNPGVSPRANGYVCIVLGVAGLIS